MSQLKGMMLNLLQQIQILFKDHNSIPARVKRQGPGKYDEANTVE